MIMDVPNLSGATIVDHSTPFCPGRTLSCCTIQHTTLFEVLTSFIIREHLVLRIVDQMELVYVFACSACA
jgi:hypothetical protein